MSTPTVKKTPTSRETSKKRGDVIVWIFGILDRGVYIFIGLAFILAAILALFLSFSNLIQSVGRNVAFYDITPQNVLDFVSDLLLVLIIMEVLGTIRSYLQEGDTTVKPFLFIGIISATRGILSIGALLSIPGETLKADEFTRKMIELGIDAVIIVALGITIRVLGKLASDKEDDAELVSQTITEIPAVGGQLTVATTVVNPPHHHEPVPGDVAS
ncbi:MAG: phosphate-starvation-inducible PsiE family protein [Ktedonobacterales bacterium]|nr:phosphate-starvation-inducible PsiE family protein [Ktedonobacterales bacterium]